MVFGQDRRSDISADSLHVVQQLADVFRVQIGAQGPAGVEITEHHRKVRQVGKHAALVVEMLGEIDRLPVLAHVDLACDRKAEACGSHDDVGADQLARFRQDTFRHETIDVVGNDLRPMRLDRFEQIGIGHQTQALVPWIIGRGEGFGIVVIAEMLLDLAGQEFTELGGVVTRALEEEILHGHVLPAGQAIGQLFWQDTAQGVGECILGRARRIPCRRALQHRDHLRLAGHGGHDGDGGRTRSNHHDPLVVIVQILRPELWMDDLACEIFPSFETCIERLIVIVIARSKIQEPGSHIRAPLIIFGDDMPKGG